MASDKDLLSRADSLINSDSGAGGSARGELPRQMRRRRSFLASSTPSAMPYGAAASTQLAPEDDNLPLLTDIVVAAEAVAEEESDDHVTASLRPALAAELAQFIDGHLADELPALVEAAALHTAKRLRDGIGASIAEALRDFVAERGQLQLPLEEPAGGEDAAADPE